MSIAIGYCQRCGREMPRRKLREDGRIKKLLVCKEDWDPPERLRVKLKNPITEPRPVKLPAPDLVDDDNISRNIDITGLHPDSTPTPRVE